MNDLNNIIDIPPFSLTKKEKYSFFIDILHSLTKHHFSNCPEYRKILNLLEFEFSVKNNIEEIPPIPVRLFKVYDFLSVDKSQIIKTMTSSGTSGQGVSKIFLDRITSTNQTKILVKIVSSFTGTKRLPMLVIDSKSMLKDRDFFSARGAGILGFSMLGYDITYALDKDMQLDFDAVEKFYRKHSNKNILIFGFTFMIWEYFYKQLVKSGKQLPLDKGIMIHGGGWKKMSEEEVDNKKFKSSLEDICSIKKVFNYYGMVEQTGSIFMECEAGYLHSSIFSDIKILRTDFSTCDKNEIGLVQLSSILPFSYPGHIILSEDTGEIMGEDDCSCGRLGKYFQIHGRVMNAEVRGCGDTHESI